MPLAPGQPLLHYRLLEKLGEGGMGVVWKALDTTLDRDVAIKILAEVFAKDTDRLARFEREAKLLAGLNHPNIAAVYSVHEGEGMRFLAMEFLPGEDLGQRLARGPLPVDEALKVAVQIATALEAAHESGNESGGILLLSLEDGTTRPLVQNPAAEWAPALSPDGNWLAYASDEAGDAEVYVRSMSDGGRWQVSEGGNTPKWSADGKELFYRDNTRFYVVDVRTEPTFSHGKPRLLFELEHVSSPGTAAYDVTPDGSHLLVVRDTSQADTTGHLNVIVDWVAGLGGGL